MISKDHSERGGIGIGVRDNTLINAKDGVRGQIFTFLAETKVALRFSHESSLQAFASSFSSRRRAPRHRRSTPACQWATPDLSSKSIDAAVACRFYAGVDGIIDEDFKDRRCFFESFGSRYWILRNLNASAASRKASVVGRGSRNIRFSPAYSGLD